MVGFAEGEHEGTEFGAQERRCVCLVDSSDSFSLKTALKPVDEIRMWSSSQASSKQTEDDVVSWFTEDEDSIASRENWSPGSPLGLTSPR